VGDHLRPRHVQVAGSKAGGHTGPAPIQRLSERQVSPVLAVIAARAGRHQRGHISSTLGQSDIVGGRHQPQSLRRQSRLQPGQPQQRAPPVGGVHEHDLNIGRVLERSLDRIGTREHWMHVAVESGAHCTPPASTSWYIKRMFEYKRRICAARLNLTRLGVLEQPHPAGIASTRRRVIQA